MLHFDTLQWAVILFSAFLIGFAKAGIMGAGALVVPALAAVMPARESVGFLLPMLIVGDVAATFFWHRHVDWARLRSLALWAATGVVIGFFLLGCMTDRALLGVIGAIVIALVLLHIFQQNRPDLDQILPHSRSFSAAMGVMAGATSMLANAGGPIVVIYLLVAGLDKRRFIGTAAVFFLCLNSFKMPFSMGLSLVTGASFATNMALAPVIVLGAAVGRRVVHAIPQRLFDLIMQVLTALIGLWLCLRALLAV